MPTPVRSHPSIDSATESWLRPILADQKGMDEVTAWLADLRPPGKVLEVLVQDEFTHDFVVGLREGLFLVYEAT